MAEYGEIIFSLMYVIILIGPKLVNVSYMGQGGKTRFNVALGFVAWSFLIIIIREIYLIFNVVISEEVKVWKSMRLSKDY